MTKRASRAEGGPALPPAVPGADRASQATLGRNRALAPLNWRVPADDIDQHQVALVHDQHEFPIADEERMQPKAVR